MRILSALPLLALLAAPSLARAQGAHLHEGFFLSMGLSPATGDINQSVTNGPFSSASYGGTTGFQLDLRVGAALWRDNILSFDVSSRAMANPTVTVDGQQGSLGGNYSAGDVITGLGFTHYFMPANAFIGVTLGQGRFTFTNAGTSGSTNQGFGYVVRAGKEWWVGRHWGMGIAGGFAHLSANDQSDPNYPGYASTLSTTRVFAGFSATYN